MLAVTPERASIPYLTAPLRRGFPWVMPAMTLALISLISAVLATCVAIFAAGVALAFWPAPHSWVAPAADPPKEVDFDNLTPEERRRVFDN
jgi:hypothetical protein